MLYNIYSIMLNKRDPIILIGITQISNFKFFSDDAWYTNFTNICEISPEDTMKNFR